MITVEDILKAGYKKDRVSRFEPNVEPYYKSFHEPSGRRLYTIVLNRWMVAPEGQGREHESVSARVQFNMRSDTPDKPCFNVDVLSPESIEHVESFFATMFERMGCVPYDNLMTICPANCTGAFEGQKLFEILSKDLRRGSTVTLDFRNAHVTTAFAHHAIGQLYNGDLDESAIEERLLIVNFNDDGLFTIDTIKAHAKSYYEKLRKDPVS